MRKILSSIIILLAILVLTGCEPPSGSKHVVNFIKDDETIKTIEVAHASKILRSELPSTPTKSGYRFSGWYDGETLFDINTMVVMIDLDLVANFVTDGGGGIVEPKPGEAAVSFYGKNDELLQTVNVTKGNKVDSYTPSSPSGYAFSGWYTSSARTTKFDFNQTINEATSIYAKYETVETGDFSGYYDTILDTDTGSTLRTKLYDIVKTGKTGTYSSGSSRPVLREADSLDGKNVYLIYDGRSVSATANADTWNQEHVVPQSTMGYKNTADVHNLRASTPSLNSKRGNYKFGSGSGSVGYLSGSQFYPGDSHVGDVARIVFYTDLRYSGQFNVSMIVSLNLALQWHAADPVDAIERNRNNVIQKSQGNRNPFIDHPEYVERIWGQSSTSITSEDFLELASEYRNTIQYGINLDSKEQYGGLKVVS